MKNKAFTLVELLVVVLIIGILAAVALPQYQTAVDKNRYATLMPMAKSLATAQESFRMANGYYSNELSDLDVQFSDTAQGITGTLPGDMTVTLGEEMDYDYVKMSKDGLKNNYIVYLNRSGNYPGEIHCEAQENNSRASRLCKALGGRPVVGSLTDGYETFVLQGNGTDTPASLARFMSSHPGWQSCDTYPCAKECNRETVGGFSCDGTYNENGSYTEKVCQNGVGGGEVCTEVTYDENGKKNKQVTCAVSEDDVCHVMGEKNYYENGKLAWESEVCVEQAEDGSCVNYSYIKLYDTNGDSIRVECGVDEEGNVCGDWMSATKTIYDEKGRELIYKDCYWQGGTTCDESSSSEGFINSYDQNGKLINQRFCSSFDGNTCTNYEDSFIEYDEDGEPYKVAESEAYLYDTKGNLVSTYGCVAFEGNNCIEPEYSSLWVDTYDDHGNKIAHGTCRFDDWDGNTCSAYRQQQGDAFSYTYDEQGNKTTTKRACKTWTGSTCSEYSSFTNNDTVEKYNAEGTLISSYRCQTWSGNTCTTYKSGSDYMYDEQGNKIAVRSCSHFDGTTCTSWGNYGYY